MQRWAWLAGLLLLMHSACFALTGSTIAPTNVQKLTLGEQALRVGHVYFPPFYFSKDQGMDADIIRAVAHQANFKKIEFVEFANLTELMTGLAHGKIDLIANGLVISPDREKKLLLSIPYYKMGGVGLLYNKKNHHYQSLDDLNLFRLGTLAASYTVHWVPQNYISPRVFKTYGTWQQLVHAFEYGEIDGIVSNFTACQYAATSHKNNWQAVLLKEIPIVYAMRKEDAALQKVLNEAIHVLWQNQTLYKIKAKHLEKTGIEPKKFE